MLSLFEEIPLVPQGFHYDSNFLSEEEEKQVLGLISEFDLNNMMFHGYTAKRKTANFGWDWSFEDRTLTKGKEIPGAFQFLIEKAAAHFGLPPETVGELLITEYPPGVVINWHRDAPPYEKIIGISLLSDCSFRFRPYEKSKQKRNNTISFAVKRRSIYMMEAESRSDWEHTIQPVKSTRYSITLRTLR